MRKKQIAAVFLLSIAIIALLGCVEEPSAPSQESQPEGDHGTQPAGGHGTQVEGPDYYGSEDEAFNALEQELDEMPEMSAEELEALLGE